MEQRREGTSWWRRCLDTRAALLSGSADPQEVRRALRLCMTLAGAGAALVATAMLGVYFL